MSNQEKSQSAFSSLSDAQLQEAEDNLTRCLDAYDQRGEQGLQEELERIHPNPELEKVGLRSIWIPFGDSWLHAVVSDQKLPTISYEDYLKAHPGFEEDWNRLYPPASAENDGRPIDLNPVIFNEKGQSVGPDFSTKKPSSNPK